MRGVNGDKIIQGLVSLLKNFDLYPKGSEKPLKSIKEETDIKFAFLNDHSGDTRRMAWEMTSVGVRPSFIRLLPLPGCEGVVARLERGQDEAESDSV